MKKGLVENEYAKIWVSDNIQFAVFKPEEVNISIAMECVSARIKAAEGEYLPVLFDSRKVKSITKEARDYFASDEGVKFVKAAALLLDSYVGKLMGNFFLQINKPKVPTRIFTNEGEALKWLKQFS